MQDLDAKVIKHLNRRRTPLKVGLMARELKLPHSTVGSCVKRLAEDNYVTYKCYGPVFLSKKGKELATELARHSQLLEVLLHEALGLSAEVAKVESEKINLLFSCETINKICEKYNHPKKCPCGEEILESSTCYCTKKQ
ncbi:MAG: metal-dependent transcriptional regulator [Candidatus Lokiarchaeota archaeon]|nr:metal-dependent transcriptional regulator [Candidatus Lokiarchaeota archaeon]